MTEEQQTLSKFKINDLTITDENNTFTILTFFDTKDEAEGFLKFMTDHSPNVVVRKMTGRYDFIFMFSGYQTAMVFTSNKTPDNYQPLKALLEKYGERQVYISPSMKLNSDDALICGKVLLHQVKINLN